MTLWRKKTMAKKKTKRAAIDIADELEMVRKGIAERQLIEKRLRAELLSAFHEEGLEEVGNYQLSKATSLKIVNFDKAWEWTEKYTAVRDINLSKARKVFQMSLTENPEDFGFEIVESERIIPKKGNEE